MQTNECGSATSDELPFEAAWAVLLSSLFGFETCAGHHEDAAILRRMRYRNDGSEQDDANVFCRSRSFAQVAPTFASERHSIVDFVAGNQDRHGAFRTRQNRLTSGGVSIWYRLSVWRKDSCIRCVSFDERPSYNRLCTTDKGRRLMLRCTATMGFRPCYE